MRTASINYAELSEFVTPYRPVLYYSAFPASWNPETTVGLMSLSREVQRQAAMIGYLNAFYMMAITAAVSVPLALLLKRVPTGR